MPFSHSFVYIIYFFAPPPRSAVIGCVSGPFASCETKLHYLCNISFFLYLFISLPPPPPSPRRIEPKMRSLL